MKGAWFEKAKLTNATLAEQDVGGGSFLMANLCCANLRNTRGFGDLRMIDLRQADIRGANLVSPNAQIMGRRKV